MCRAENCRCERAGSASRTPSLDAAAVGDALVAFTVFRREIRVGRAQTVHMPVEGCQDNESVHSTPLFRKECPKRRRNALPRAGFMLEKRLIFPGDASPSPGSHAVAAEMLSPLTRVSGSKVQYSRRADMTAISLLSTAIYPGMQLENARRGRPAPQLHPVIRARNAEHDRNSHDCDRERPARTNSDEVCNQNGHADENGLPEGPSQIEHRWRNRMTAASIWCCRLIMPCPSS